MKFKDLPEVVHAALVSTMNEHSRFDSHDVILRIPEDTRNHIYASYSSDAVADSVIANYIRNHEKHIVRPCGKNISQNVHGNETINTLWERI